MEYTSRLKRNGQYKFDFFSTRSSRNYQADRAVLYLTLYYSIAFAYHTTVRGKSPERILPAPPVDSSRKEELQDIFVFAGTAITGCVYPVWTDSCTLLELI